MKARSAAWLALFLVAACYVDPKALAEKYTTTNEQHFARDYVALVARSQVDSAFDLLLPAMQTDTARAGLESLAIMLHDARLDSLRIVGFSFVSRSTTRGSYRDVSLAFEAPTSDNRWIVTNVATHEVDGHAKVSSFTASSLPEAAEVINRFTFKGKTARHYLFLLLACIATVLSVGACVAMVRSRGMPRRWLWAFLALVGSPVFMLNWTTGQMALRNAYFVLLGSGWVKAGPASPAIISVAIPLGAAVALLRRRAWRDARRTAETPPLP